jgi:hypothetical protein
MRDEIEATESQKRTASMAGVVDYTNIARFYANHAQINITLFEIRLVMNFLSGINPENNHLVALETMFVSMSPELARAVHALLGRALENYARDYGSLRGPASAGVKLVGELDEASKRALDMAEPPTSEKK